MSRRIVIASALFVLFSSSHLWAWVPLVINYQGQLTNAAGDPVADSSYSVVFTIYDQSYEGTSKWTETRSVTTSGGLFTVLLGNVTPLSDTVFNSAYRWLGIKVGTDPELYPRTMLTTVPYSFRTATVDGADGGNIRNQVSIGSGHDNSGIGSFVAGGSNTASQFYTVSIGSNNESSGFMSVTLGASNRATNHYAAVLGGQDNISSAIAAVVTGGDSNEASGDYAAVLGGTENAAIAYGAVVGGGQKDTASGSYSHVGGGNHNVARGYASTISGGFLNKADTSYSTVGGGNSNIASERFSTVSGGLYCKARGEGSVVAGGGGYDADSNSASGLCSAIPGGRGNIAAGDFSFAAGLRAQANHPGCFVWADGTDADFMSSDNNQFLIRAAGGVGINTTSPTAPLTIKSVDGSGNEILRLALERTWAFRQYNTGAASSLELKSLTAGADKDFLICTEGNVGIGDAAWSPTSKLSVQGDINVTGNIKKGGVDYTHPDYVFEPDYELMSLEELKKYVFEHKHLPNVISADEVKANDGFNLDELLIQMLEKIEEQTLYILQLEERSKEVSELKTENTEMKSQLAHLTSQVEKIQAQLNDNNIGNNEMAVNK